jgi:hypothetical protein
VADLVAWALFFTIAAFGTLSTIMATVWLWRFLRGRVEPRAAALVVAAGAVLAWLGLWILFDVGWLIGSAIRLVLRTRSDGPSREGGRSN